jgi:hypothetical protein
VTVVSTAPDAPSGLIATNITKFTATLVWTAGADGRAVTYRVYEQESKGNKPPQWTLVASDVTTLSYLLDKWNQPNQVHTVAVTGVDAAGRESALSARVDVLLQRK